MPIQPAGRQGQQQRNRPHQRHYARAQSVGGAHYRAARVGHGRHAGFAHQAHVMACTQGGEQGRGVDLGMAFAAVVPFFVDSAGQFGDVLLLQRHGEREQGVNAFEVGAAAFGVFAHPMRKLGGLAQRACRQHLGQVRLAVATEIQRGGHQVQGAGGAGRAHGSTSPAARSRRQVRIKGSPISAVGSSLSMASSKLMPRPSLFALPAQS